MQLLTRNSKMKKSGKKFFDFAILPVVSCPQALSCKKYCYGQQCRYCFPKVKNCLKERYEVTKTREFCDRMASEIFYKKATHIRIHSTGDFYNRTYLKKWLQIMECFPEVKFYCYTKSVKLLKSIEIPSNFYVTYSFGGKQDSLINKRWDRHAVVFSSVSYLQKSGYHYGNESDLIALSPKRKIGLVYHGIKKIRDGDLVHVE